MKKSISEAQVKRMRNLVTKKYGSKTEIRAGYTKKREVRAEGDIWEERGKTWTIKNGIKQSVSKLGLARKTHRKSLCCPKCGGPIKSRYDHKMMKFHNMCFSCVTKFEQQLIIDGKYKEYEKNIMKGNYESWIDSVKDEYQDFISSVKGKQFITEAGHVEDWSGDNSSQLVEKTDKYISRIKTEFEGTIDG